MFAKTNKLNMFKENYSSANKINISFDSLFPQAKINNQNLVYSRKQFATLIFWNALLETETDRL
jgi:hypothetical protein